MTRMTVQVLVGLQRTRPTNLQRAHRKICVIIEDVNGQIKNKFRRLLGHGMQIQPQHHSMGTNIMRMLVEIKQLLQQSILLNQQRGIPGATAEVEEEDFSLPVTSKQELLTQLVEIPFPNLKGVA